jgi:PKD repeat protein
MNRRYDRFSAFETAIHWDTANVRSFRPAGLRGGRLTRLGELAFACAVGLLLILAWTGTARAADPPCPNPNPVVNENVCKTGSSNWQVTDYSHDLGGYTTKTSVDLGEDVVLKIGRDASIAPQKTVNIDVYRMGYYDGDGGRLVKSATNVPINNSFACKPMDPITGEVDCGNWSPTYTIPGSSLPASGIYLAKLTASTGEQTQVVFTVRDDSRSAKMLFVLPITDYQAYNLFGGKSLYFGNAEGDTVGSPTPATGTDRAAKVSFNRPFTQAGAMQNWFLGPDFDLLSWVEKQGYDISYSDDVAVHSDPAQLLDHDADVVSGHSEYWSEQQFKGFKAAREAGVNIASFSANAAYWKVRYENGARTLVCYKTVQGSGTLGNGSASQNDWGPDGLKGTADDALGLDGEAGTADDNPQNSTTTFRDNGAPKGDPNAPAGGRVGPDMPENELWGVLYLGDDDSFSWPLTVPAGNGKDEFAADRIWRNTGISENSSTNIGNRIVNWEWDAVPTQPQYLAHQPANVVKLSATAITGGSPETNWLLDEGRIRGQLPPPGQPNTVNAVKYKAASGALVFATGTMLWSHGLSNEPQGPIEQATYNVFSDMGVQPVTPEEELVLDPGGSNPAPNASFTASPNPTKTSTTVTFNGAASSDANGTIAKYEWDLDGNGSYETNTATKATTTHSYSLEGEYAVRLKVTDNGGATDFAVRTVTVINNQPPTASFTATPLSPVVGEATAFNASASKDPDGTIAKYEWDLDGNGSYETNTGSTPTASRAYTAVGDVTIGLRVTDNGGKNAAATTTISVTSNGVSNYSPTVLGTPGLIHYWRLNETAGTTFVDSVGASPATTSGGPTLGTPGGVPNDSDKSTRFDGVDDAASAQVDLSGTPAITVEFWLKWSSYTSLDHLALEFTKNFNDNSGGFLIDPDAQQLGGTFGVGVGSGASRNNVFFARPSAGQWHHYAFVLDTAAPAATEITPYVDGEPVAYSKLDNGSGGGFANSTLSLMSRATSTLFGAGDLDEVAIYNRALGAGEVDEHFNSDSANKRPTASFTAPATAKAGIPVAFDASASKDPDGTIAKYEWDLDGNGSYETSTAATATVSHTYTANGSVKVGLRVTDSGGAIGTTTRSLLIEGGEEPGGGEEKTSNYSPTVLSTPGLAHYWRLNETSGTSFADSVGGTPATTSGEPTLGVAGGIPNDSSKAARFDGSNDAASAQVNLSASKAITVEFWMKWNAWANDDDLAMEFTNNFNQNAGGFLIDPNAPQLAGSFGVGIGAEGPSRNNVFFARPSAGQWHHYAFVLDTTAPASQQVTPYVDGAPVAYTKLDSGTGALPFANSTLSFMSRASSGLFGAGDLDEVAIYDRALNAGTIDEHFNSDNANKRPTASFTAPTSAKVGETVSFDASASKDSDGTVAKYAWDLDGNGTYETDTGTTATVDHAYETVGDVKVGLQVTDNLGATGAASRTVSVVAAGGGEEPVASSYSESVLGTPGLTDYWRLNETSGSTFADSVGGSAAAIVGEPVLGIPGGVPNDSDKAASFNGDKDAASAAVGSLAGKAAATVEFWMKWDSYNNEDDLAMELTNNFNETPGGFLVDPNSGYGSFAVGIGIGSSRNVSLFARPSVGTWHHYAFVLDTTAAAGQQVVPYVDGQPVAFTKAESGTGAPAFAEAALSFMSRAASGLTGAGDLDEVALYDRALSATTIADHFALSIFNVGPEASFTASPNPAPSGANVIFNAAASKDPDGSIAKYAWDLDGNGSYETDTGTTATTSRAYATPGQRTIGLRVTDNSGATATTSRTITIQNVAPTASFTATPNPVQTGNAVTYNAAGSSDADGAVVKYEWDLDGNGSYETDTGATANASGSYPTIGARTIGMRVTDDLGGTATTTRSLSVVNSPPLASFTATPNPALSGTAVAFNAGASSDSDGTVTKYEWDLDGNGSYETSSGATATTSKSFATPGNRTIGLRVTDNSGATATTTQSLSVQNRAPTASFTATPATALTGAAIAFNAAGSSDPDGTIAKYEWDFDGNGAYETDAGTTASTSHAFAAAGTITVGLRVTDNSGDVATTTRTVTIQNSPPTASFGATPNPAPTGTTVAYDASASKDPDGAIAKYEWDLDGNGTYEANTGTTASASSSYATVGARTIRLRVTDNSGATATTTQTVTVTNRAPVPSFTISANPVQSLVNVTLNASASKDPDGTIAKYEWDLDGNGSYEINAGSTASGTRSFSTSGERAVGLRVTDNLGATATTTVNVNVTNRAPTASFTASPTSVPTGTNTTLNAAATSDPDGTIAKYEWDLDNNGSYETSSGATASLTTSYATAGTKTIGLRVTDNSGATAATTRTVTVTNRAPTASFTATPNPVAPGATVSFNASGSVDPDGTIAKYEWDLDGNGSYEINTGTAPTTSKSFSPAGSKTIGLRVTDNTGATGAATQTVTVVGSYNNAVRSTAGLIDYWRLGESSGTTLANSVAGAPSASRTSNIFNSGATLGVAGPLTLDSNTAISFDGANDDADVALNLSSNSTLTIEFWLKWTTFSNNDDLAFELTSNFNNSNGGFLVNPNSTTSGSRFEVALGRGTSRNNAYFTRPSANVWHHYAIVLNTTAAAAQQILVYVDGAPVAIAKGSSGTGAGNFANSTLNFMSRNGSSLYGAGSLDEVALYNQALSATQISQHYAAK